MTIRFIKLVKALSRALEEHELTELSIETHFLLNNTLKIAENEMMIKIGDDRIALEIENEQEVLRVHKLQGEALQDTDQLVQAKFLNNIPPHALNYGIEHDPNDQDDDTNGDQIELIKIHSDDQ